MPHVSIVMANYNRRQLLINTLRTIEHYNKERSIHVIVVDDASDKGESVIDVPDLFEISVSIIPIKKEEKNWKCDCMPFNIGFSLMSKDTDIVIIQNPENLHVGDIVGYALKNSRPGLFLSFALLSMNQADTDNLFKKAISKKIYDGPGIKKMIGQLPKNVEHWTDGETCWYNHSIWHPAFSHLTSAIKRKDLEDLGGFDERYGPGFAYTDFDLRERITRKKMINKIVDEPFAIHQRHSLAAYGKYKTEFERNGWVWNNITLKERGHHAPANYFYCPPKRNPLVPTLKLDADPITGDKDSFVFLNLGNVPLVNNLCSTRDESLSMQRFPLSVQMFRKSKLACITDIVNKDTLFLNYMYQSGINKPYLDHCAEMYDHLDEQIHFKKDDLILDIGGNDGSLLMEFQMKNSELQFLNIDASQTFIEINKKAGIPYVNKFFDESFVLEDKKACVITSTNVFQHTQPIRSFVKGVYNNLADDGIWCLEFPYLITTLLNDNYDQVYHEHVFYFLLTNIVDLLSQEGMKVINTGFSQIHSGTMRVLSCKKEAKWQPDRSIQTFLNMESMLTEEYYVEWGKKTMQKIDRFTNFVQDLKDKGASIACFGAAAKGCVFLNTCGIDDSIVKFIIDDTPFKQGKFVPGTGIQVVGREVLKTEKIDYMIILAHNFRDYIMNSLKGEYSGKYVIMFPSISII